MKSFAGLMICLLSYACSTSEGGAPRAGNRRQPTAPVADDGRAGSVNADADSPATSSANPSAVGSTATPIGDSSGASTAAPSAGGYTPTATSGDATGCAGATDVEACQGEQALYRLVNALRVGNGLPPFKVSARLGQVARGWSRRQAAAGSISHDGFPAARYDAYQAAFPGSSARIYAENVGLGRGGPQAAAQMLFRMWSGSPAHYANMMGRYGAAGMGLARSDGSWYGTQIFGETDE